MEALKAIKIIGNQNDGRAVFLCLPNTGEQRVLNFMRDPKLAHILVFAFSLTFSHKVIQDEVAESGLLSILCEKR